MKTISTLIISLFILFYHSNAVATTIYVDASSTGANDGTSWVDAFVDLQLALQNDTDGDTIKVAQGIYYPSVIGRTIYFSLDKNIVLLGGYNSSTGARDYAYNSTVLSGNFQSDGNSTNNSKTILISSKSSLIDGFTFQDGYADGVAVNERTGAAIINTNDLKVNNCIFKNNVATGAGPSYDSGIGGAIFSNTASGGISINNSLFYDNSSTGNGGAISADNGTVEMVNCTFYHNESSKGTFSYFHGIPTITNCIFAGNTTGKDINNDGPETLTVSNTILQSDASFPSGTVTIGGNQLSTDPMLINPSGNDFRLSSASPAIDAGLNGAFLTSPKDLKQVDRILNGTVDIGAFEYCTASTNSLTVNLCNSLSYTSPSGNHTWNTSGIYKDTVPNHVGCDSIITIDLTIKASAQSDTTHIMECYSYSPPSGNYTWNTTGFYHDTILNSIGCDSILNIDLVILAPKDTIHVQSCTYYDSPSGNYTWSTPGIHYDTITNPSGCDTILTVNLTLNSTRDTINEDVCYSYSSPSLNHTWTTSGVYHDTLPNSVGCDSIITINLRVLGGVPSKVIYVDSSVSASGDGTSWSTAYSTIQQALDSVNGCEQVVDTVKVAKGTYFPPNANNDSLPILMKHRTVLLGGYNSSTHERNIKLFPTILSGEIQQDNNINNNSKTILKTKENYSIIDGFIIEKGFASGDYCVCDLEDFSGAGIYTKYDLTVKNCIFRNNHVDATNGYGIGAALYASYTSDSLRVINCTFYNNSSTGNGGAVTFDKAPGIINNCVFFNNSSPEGAIHVWDNEVTISNTIFLGNQGSDIDNNTLDSVKVYNSLFDAGFPTTAENKGGNLVFNNPLFVNPGAGNFNLQESSPAINAGRNNIAKTAFDAKNEPRVMGNIIDMGVNENCNNISTISIDNQGETLISDANFVTYQWVDCNNGYSAINGETNQQFTPTVSGNYAVLIDNGLCSDTSNCEEVTIAPVDPVGLTSFSSKNQIMVYPNPTNGCFFIESDTPFDQVQLTLTNVLGSIIQNTTISGQTKIEINIQQPNGVYFLQLEDKNSQHTNYKIIKK